MRDKIEAVLDARVRPVLQSHGGTIEIVSLEDGVLRFRYLGACCFCPSAASTTEHLVRSDLKSAFPALREIIPVQPISESLIEQAMKILRHEN